MNTIKEQLLMSAIIAGITGASLLLSDPAHAGKKKADRKAKNTDLIQCFGVNSCKGAGNACSIQPNGKVACQGKNECKGMGGLKMTLKECFDKKGNAHSLPQS